MEFAPPLSNIRTQLCIVVTGFSNSIDRDAVWTPAAEDFLRRAHKLGLLITIVGPRPPKKFGSKRTIRFMDRHEVIGMKVLAASRSHKLELRILSSKTKAWTRLRAEACVTFGPNGVWPGSYEGWTLPGTLTINALSRWVGEQKWVPGREFAFLGSTNQVLRWASILLDRGAKSCFVIEQGAELRCWRAHRDRFIAKGGRILPQHQLQKVIPGPNNALEIYLNNDQGTMIATADTMVLAPVNEDALNSPSQWKYGMYYVHRRSLPWEKYVDEEQWLERSDWREIYWRISKFFELSDHAEAEGALRMLRVERRKMLEYRKPGARKDLGYSGKILDRETLGRVYSSSSVPRSFAHVKPVASLECFENLPCRACADVCPENAIEMLKLTDQPKLLEDKCTGCGACVAVCPAGAAVMIKELPQHQKARFFLPDNTKELWKQGRAVQLLNRKGDNVGVGRVMSATAYEGAQNRILEIESTNVHLWDARNFKSHRGEFHAHAGHGHEIEAGENSPHSPVLLKRGWVTLNGVKRLCPVGVPVTVALWQLGQRRFEDAQFCHDSGCRLCEVLVDGKPALACKTLVRDGQEISFAKKTGQLSNPLCPCKQVSASDYSGMMKEGVPESLVREITKLAQGTCHGRWCLASPQFACEGGEKPRPIFHGYEASPWRDIWASDVVEGDRDSADSED